MTVACSFESTFYIAIISTPGIGTSYFDAKQGAVEYRKAKLALKGPEGPFAAWATSGREWESFSVDGEVATQS